MIRWFALGLLVFIAGGACCWLYDRGRIEDIGGILFMAGLAAFFYAGDAHVDELFAQDAKKAQHEANS